ncbi:MAG: hypothetical protein ABII25_09930, partial [bacterium]
MEKRNEQFNNSFDNDDKPSNFVIDLKQQFIDEEEKEQDRQGIKNFGNKIDALKHFNTKIIKHASQSMVRIWRKNNGT